MGSRRHILVLAKAYPPVAGGVETYSEQVAIAYQHLGFDTTVVTQFPGPSGISERVYGGGHPVQVINVGPGGQLKVAVEMLRTGRRLVRSMRPWMVHATTWRPGLVAQLLGASGRLVVTVHGREVTTVSGALLKLMRRVLRSARLVVSVSTSTLERTRVALGDPASLPNAIVAGNGISYRATIPSEAEITRKQSDEGELRVLTLARLVERKNLSRAIQAVVQARREGLQIRYRIAGTGPLKDALTRAIVENEAGEYIQVLGYVDEEDIPALYSWATVFLHPQLEVGGGADFEGFGLTIADAMSFGAVAIAGTGPGPSDFVRDGVTGRLVDGTDVREISDAVTAIGVSSEERLRLSLNGHRYVTEHLSWTKHVEMIVTAFEQTI